MGFAESVQSNKEVNNEEDVPFQDHDSGNGTAGRYHRPPLPRSPLEDADGDGPPHPAALAGFPRPEGPVGGAPPI